jgi:hypothetical protein
MTAGRGGEVTGEAGIRVRTPSKGWMRRVIQLSGAVDALLEYDGMGLGINGQPDYLRVDGRRVTSLPGTTFLRAERRFAFPLRKGHRTVECRLEVSISSLGLYQIQDVALFVDGKLVYRERSRDPLDEQDTLPIPAGHPDTVVQALPLPGNGEGHGG